MRPDRRHRFVGHRRTPAAIRAAGYSPSNTTTRVVPRVIPPQAPKPGTKMRFRTDGWCWADQDVADMTDDQIIAYYGRDELERVRATPRAEPGDTWRVFWAKQRDTDPDVLAGYAICCPKCKRIHHWTTASNCSFQPTVHTYKDSDGKDRTYTTCGHSGKSSCWTWTNSAEENKLTGRASLWCQSSDCGWHGYLTDGVLTEC